MQIFENFKRCDIYFCIIFVENHVFEATKKSEISENKKQKVRIYTILFQNQHDIKKKQKYYKSVY